MELLPWSLILFENENAMKKSFVAAFALAAMSALSLFAADIDGTWVRKVGKRDSITEKLVLKSSGTLLSGTFEAGGGKLAPVPISEGKISGNDVSFKVVRATPDKGGSVTLVYSGKLDGPWNTLTLNVTSDGTFKNPSIELPPQDQVFTKQ
jgi:hypothetical protein